MTELTQDAKTPAGSPLPEHPRVFAAINRGSGTVRSLGADAVKAQVEKGLSAWGSVEVALLDGSGIGPAVAACITDNSHDIIVVGGGDGTISSVAGQLAGTGIAMGILPLGTMNMVAKSINLKPALDQAIAQLAAGRIGLVDVGRVNGMAFLHQVSFGLQPRVVRIREKIGYRSRLTKMMSGTVAIINVLARPRAIRMVGIVDGTETRLRLPALAISNNLYRNDRLAVPERLDGGVLGIYMVSATRWRDYLRLILAALRGTWKDDDMVQAQAALHVRLQSTRRFGRAKNLASVDGELVYLKSPIDISIEPRALRMVLPVEEGTSASGGDGLPAPAEA